MAQFTVRLNGTDENPFLIHSLQSNPFPQQFIPDRPEERTVIGAARVKEASSKHRIAVLHVQELGGSPIPDADYIRRHLQGFAPDFVELCVQNFRPGEMVEFTVSFPL